MAKKIIFMGTPMFAVPILKSLYQNGYPVTCVYTQPPQKSHRGQKINKSPIQGISETLNLEYRAPSTLKENKEEYEFFKSVDADLVIVVAYGQIIPKEFLSLTKKGFINIHASILPNWRGAAPIQRAIMNLDKETGVSIMKIEEKLDTGPVCNTYKINMENNFNTAEIAEKLSFIAAEKILDNVDDILEDKATFVAQDHSKATYEEGCLSVPNQFADIDRPSKCEVEYLDYNGQKQLLKAEGLLATCIQHEMDHLEGILFIDYLSKLKKSMIIKKLTKLKSSTAEI